MAFTRELSHPKSFAVLRLLARVLFGAVLVVYLNHQLSMDWLLWAALGCYTALQAALLRNTSVAEIAATGIDFVAITAAIWLDPAPLPPTLLMFLALTLSAGLLHGLQRFIIIASLSVGILSGLFLLTARHLDNPAAIYFALTLMVLCCLYAGVLLWRYRRREHFIREAAWQDPETGLISHRALLTTAGWLLPLHDRLSQTVTLVLLKCPNTSTLQALTEQLSRRLRRSDIAARYSEHTVALALPGTTLKEAESVLGVLRAEHPYILAAMVAACDAQRSLESILQHLEQHLQRAGDSSGHWLVQATALD